MSRPGVMTVILGMSEESARKGTCKAKQLQTLVRVPPYPFIPTRHLNWSKCFVRLSTVVTSNKRDKVRTT